MRKPMKSLTSVAAFAKVIDDMKLAMKPRKCKICVCPNSACRGVCGLLEETDRRELASAKGILPGSKSRA
jgi:hypothetical protein